MAKSKYYYVMAKFQDGPRFVAKALLAHDIFTNSIFTDNYHDAFASKDRSDAIAMRNKMEVSNYTYFDPIGKMRYSVKWDIVEREVNVSDSVYRKTL